MFAAFNKSHKKNIRRAIREDLQVRFDRSKNAIDKFYAIHTANRKRLGVPVQPRRFFDLFWEQMIRRDLGFVVLAYSAAKPISGGVFLKYGSVLTAKYSGSNPDYLAVRPMNLVFWRAIEWACVNGYKTFDFGKSKLSNVGLRRFKDGWGAVETPLAYSTIQPEGITGLAKSDSSSLLDRAHSVLEVAAQKTIQKSPAFVCRAAGELLYRYFG